MLFRMLCLVLLLPTRSGLLKSIDPILSADLLHILRSMGHGDKLVICDVNFPAAEVASKTVSGKHIFLEGGDCMQPGHCIPASPYSSLGLPICLPVRLICGSIVCSFRYVYVHVFEQSQ